MRVAIANRGEVAIRIMRACEELGYHSILLHSIVDRGGAAWRLADETVELKGENSKETYLNISQVVAAAKSAGADLVHPGFGFLSENPEFARQVDKNGMRFVGPNPKAMMLLGNKIAVKTLADKLKIPVTPYFLEPNGDAKKALAASKKIGFPVILKAAAGGGGKGMKLVEQESDFAGQWLSAIRETEMAFGNRQIFVEKFIRNPRHIEIQIFGDTHGDVVHFGERECSIQRRFQKIVEESPSPALREPGLRESMADAAIRLCKTAGYDNAGTVEFILDEDGQHYLMEMNTRLQVEHPVTEMVYSVDLVQLQFKVALGEKLPLPQSQIQPQGHAIEVRIYAEDTANGFLPSSGKLTALHLAYGPNRRFDFGYTAGDEITNDYDPMLGKIITWADNRPDNLDRLHATLSRTVITGVKTNIDFLKNLIRHTKFAAGKTHTGFIASEYGGKFSPSNPTKEFSAWINKQNLPSDSGATTSNNPTWISPWQSSTVSHSNPKQNIHTTVIDSSTSAANVSQNGRLSSPMPATVVSMSCKAGSKVKEGDLLAILEAMKMEYPLAAPFDGKIAKIHAKAGDKVGLGDLIIEITR